MSFNYYPSLALVIWILIASSAMNTICQHIFQRIFFRRRSPTVSAPPRWLNEFFTTAKPKYSKSEKNGPIFLVYVDGDQNAALLLKEVLEGVNEEANFKLVGGHQYEVLYHERDFIPGMLITENIHHCVNACSWVVVILTPKFLKSNWARLEFSIANDQNKVIIIKLLLNDVEEKELNELLSLPKNSEIKCHLKSITYLKWTGNKDDVKFWKWLVYLLPKKK